MIVSFFISAWVISSINVQPIPPPFPASMKLSCGRVYRAYFPFTNSGCSTTLRCWFFEISTHDACFGYGRRQVTRYSVRIKAFATKYTINPAIFVGRQTHVVDICFIRVCVRQLYRIFPEAKIIDAIGTFGDGEERFSFSCH